MVTTPTSPPAQQAPRLVYDLYRDTVLMFGSSGVATQFWSYDGATWTEVAAPVLPQPRREPGLVYDLGRGVTLLYGGIDQTSTTGYLSSETWTWDGQNWTALAPATSPGGLVRFALAYDWARDRVVLYGGRSDLFVDQSVSSLTWEWDGTTWALVATGGPGPRERLAMCFLTAIGKTVVFGGGDTLIHDDSTWLFDGAQWQLAPVTGPRPPARIDATMVEDPIRGVCLLVGGSDPATGAILDDTWEFDGTSWRQLPTAVSPPRTESGVAFDWIRQRMVLFGGRTASTALRLDTWEYAASHRTYGNGCIGTFGRPTLVGGQAPALGQVGTVTLTNLDPSAPFALLAIGRSRTQWAFGTLPASLAFAGMPGCVAYASADEFRLLAASGGAATWTFQVPNEPRLFAAQVFLQGVSFDPPRNAAGAVTSNGDVMTLGW